MRGRFSIVLLVILFAHCIIAQINPGARQIALSNSDVAQSDDVFSNFSNPAGLSQMNWREIGIYYSPAPFGMKELANGYIAYIEPTDYGSFGLGAMTYGFDLYKQNKISLSYSNRFEEKFFAGITINYHTIAIKNYGSANSLSLNFGSMIYLISNLKWGFAFHNVTRATFGDEKNQIPTVLQTGFSYSPLDNATLNTAVEKESEFPLSIRFGLEYSPIKYFYLRSGFSTEPEKFSAGVGINYTFIQLDYAVFTHAELGLTHQAGIIINFSGDELRNEKIKKHLGLE
ncbi:MAG: hypothetical protein NTX22_02405 [Ignavibacteriales bacterium]|nr:hypothetical protein [Ignavibacteriales bacterium]